MLPSQQLPAHTAGCSSPCGLGATASFAVLDKGIGQEGPPTLLTGHQAGLVVLLKHDGIEGLHSLSICGEGLQELWGQRGTGPSQVSW